MPITVRGTTDARAGRVLTTLGSLAGSFEGTTAAAPSFSGRIISALGGVAASMRGQFAVPSNRNGRINATLGGLTAEIQSAASILSLEPRVMLGKLMPAYSSGVGYPYSKHVTFAFRATDGRMYGHGGDFPALPNVNQESYRTDMYSIDVREAFSNVSTATAGWRQEIGYCEAAVAGGIQPKFPDVMGWVWDSTRDRFWSVPGFHVSNFPSDLVCSGKTNGGSDDPLFKFNHILSYSPDWTNAASAWTDHGNNTLKVSSESLWFSVYDPVTDTIIRAQTTNTSGDTTRLDVMDCAATMANGSGGPVVWAQQNISLGSVSGTPVGAWNSEMALDVEGRWLYLLDYFSLSSQPTRLFRVQVDDLVDGTLTMENLGLAPVQLNIEGKNGLLAWDSVSRRVVFFEGESGSGGTLWYYNPITAIWERIFYTANPSQQPYCRHSFVFDPLNNAICLLGEEVGQPSSARIWVHRYQQAAPDFVTSNARKNVLLVSSVTNGKPTLRSALPAEWDQATGLGNGATGTHGAAFVAPWGTMVVDQAAKKSYLTGGGHSDSSNNGLHGFDHNGTTQPNGAFVEDISALSAVISGSSTYSDGKPSAIHVYDGLDIGNGRIWRSGGSRYGPTGPPDKRLRSYNLTTKAWADHGDPGFSTSSLAYHVQYDKRTGYVLVMCSDAGRYSVFNSNTNAWVSQNQSISGGVVPANSGDHVSSVFDPKRGRLLLIGAGLVAGSTRMRRLDFSTAGVLTNVGFVGGGSVSDIDSQGSPAVCYDEDLDRIWAMAFDDGASVAMRSRLYDVHPETYVFTRHDLTGSIDSGTPTENVITDPPNTSTKLLHVLTGWDSLLWMYRVDQGMRYIRKPDIGQTALWG